MTWWNPKTWFSKGAEPPPAVSASSHSAYVRFELDRPFAGVFWAEPNDRPWVRVDGLSYEEAASWLPGKSLDWAAIPLAWRELLEKEPGFMTIQLEQIKEYVRG